MIQQKNIGSKKNLSLFVFVVCIGFGGETAKAIDLALPTSIHEILPPEQIEKVKESRALQTVQQDRVQNALKNQIGSNASAMQQMISMRLGGMMSSKIGAQVKEKTILQSMPLDTEKMSKKNPVADNTHQK